MNVSRHMSSAEVPPETEREREEEMNRRSQHERSRETILNLRSRKASRKEQRGEKAAQVVEVTDLPPGEIPVPTER